MPLNTVALELVPPNLDRGAGHTADEAYKVARLATESGVGEQLGHVMIPAMIAEDGDRPIEMKPKMDVLEHWSAIQPQLPGVRGLCTQVTSFSDETVLRARLTDLSAAGFDGVIFVGVPRTMSDGEGSRGAPTDA